MARYWPSSFFTFLWTETKLRSIKKAKKEERRQYPAILTEQAWSIKDLLYGQKIKLKNFAQSEHRIRFILPARGANHIIKMVI